MKRPVESQQRKMRLIALRIEGSTGTPSLEGPGKLECTIADTAAGTYTLTFDKAFKQVPIVVCTVEGADKCATAIPTKTSVVIKCNDIDETAALSDDDINVLIIGSDDSSVYA